MRLLPLALLAALLLAGAADASSFEVTPATQRLQLRDGASASVPLSITWTGEGAARVDFVAEGGRVHAVAPAPVRLGSEQVATKTVSFMVHARDVPAGEYPVRLTATAHPEQGEAEVRTVDFTVEVQDPFGGLASLLAAGTAAAAFVGVVALRQR